MSLITQGALAIPCSIAICVVCDVLVDSHDAARMPDPAISLTVVAPTQPGAGLCALPAEQVIDRKQMGK